MTRSSLLIFASVGVVACSSPTEPTSLTLDTPIPITSGVGLPPRADTPRPSSTDNAMSATPTAFEVDGGVEKIRGEIEAPGSVAWRITTDDPWITLTTASGVGSGTFVAALEPNLCDSFMRHGTLRVDPGNMTITVSQDGSDVGAC